MKKNILITGAGGNLGKAVVAKFLQEGYRVHATATPGKKTGYENSEDVVLYPVDLTDEESASEIVNAIVKNYLNLNAALFLVGGYASGSISNTTSGLIKKMLDLNFFTAYQVVRPTFQHMLTQTNGGRMVLVGSKPALIASEGKKSLAYALAKTLIFKLADFLNAEGKEKNVVTSVIVPSTIDTPENRQAMPDADFSNWVTPQAVADSIYFLISDAGSVLRDPVLKLYNKA